MNFADMLKWASLLQTVASMAAVAIKAASNGDEKAAKAADVLTDASADITGYIRAGDAFDEAYAARLKVIADEWENRDGELAGDDFRAAAEETRSAAQTLRDVMAARRAG